MVQLKVFNFFLTWILLVTYLYYYYLQQTKTVENNTFNTDFVDVQPGNYIISVRHYSNRLCSLYIAIDFFSDHLKNLP